MKWIKTEDLRPQFGHWVLFFTHSGIKIGSFWKDGWRDDSGKHYYLSEVSHWMQLPELPKN